MRGNDPPELESFLHGSFIHRVLKQAGFQVSDGVPVDVDITCRARCTIPPPDQEREIALRSARAPCNRMHRNADHMCARLLHMNEEIFVPMSFAFNFVRIGDGHPAKEHRISLRIDKVISMDGNQRHFLRIWICLLLGITHMPPLLGRLRWSDVLREHCERKQRERNNG